METLMTLEDFHQLVLFHMMEFNGDADGYADRQQWVAIDMNGALFVYGIKPTVFEEGGYWRAATMFQHYNNMYVKPPEGIDWKDCKWKL